MKIIVVGAGVIGVTTAYYLAREGHEVTVIDRQADVAQETSFANAGQISPGYAAPWAAPGIPSKALRWLLMRHAPLIIQPGAIPTAASWLAGMLGNCTQTRYAHNKRLMVELATFSRTELEQLRLEVGLSYEGRCLGTLQLFRTQEQVDNVGKDIEVLLQSGCAFELLDRRGCLNAEPGLALTETNISGGLRLPGDETGNCKLFTEQLAALSGRLGVEFAFGETASHFVAVGGKVVTLVTDRRDVTANAFVLAGGAHSTGLAQTVGLKLPIYPVKGYSITVPVHRADAAPVSTVLDESYKVAITRLGDSIRVGGMAEIAGFDLSLPDRRRETLLQSLRSLFPEAEKSDEHQFWCGLRPMTPDGTPIIGPTRLGNLFLNCGHGTLGWTMACGSARLLADLIGNKRTAIDAEGYALARYG